MIIGIDENLRKPVDSTTPAVDPVGRARGSALVTIVGRSRVDCGRRILLLEGGRGLLRCKSSELIWNAVREKGPEMLWKEDEQTFSANTPPPYHSSAPNTITSQPHLP